MRGRHRHLGRVWCPSASGSRKRSCARSTAYLLAERGTGVEMNVACALSDIAYDEEECNNILWAQILHRRIGCAPVIPREVCERGLRA